jgi:hypothetical protein
MDWKEAACNSPSSTEVEYQEEVKGACEAVWLKRMLSDMTMQHTEPTPLFFDNQGILKLTRNPVFHKRTKYVEIHCHFIRQFVEDGSIALHCCPRGPNYKHFYQVFTS